MRLKQRIVMCLALVAYCVGIIYLAVYPTDHVTFPEWVVIAFAAVAIIGLIAYASPAVRIPGERYAFLVTGFVGLTTLLFYLIGDESPPDYRQWQVTLLLLTGIIAGYGSYIIDDDPELAARRREAER